MAGRIRKIFINTKSLVYAIVIHLGVLALLLFSFDWGSTTIKSSMAKPQVEPIKAKMVSEADVQKQLDRIKAREEEKKRKELEAKKRLDDLLKQQQLEKQRLADLEKKKRLEAQQANALAEKRKKEEIRLAKLKREEDQKKRAAQKKREAEERRRAEEQRRREQAEKKKKQELARREAERQAQLKAQLEAEAEARRVAEAVNDARSRYIPIIQQKVDRNWTRPSGLKGLNAGVRVRLTPGGEVISAKVVRSSGNPVFDRSVENAILKASPLPIPSDRRINEQFRDIQFNFDPDRNFVSSL